MGTDDLAHTFTGAALYCKAYHIRDLRQYPGWSEIRDHWKPERLVTGGDDKAENYAPERPLADDEVVFLHDDLTVTFGSVRDENVIFRAVTPEWRLFCIEQLGFRIPDDLIYRLKRSDAEAPT